MQTILGINIPLSLHKPIAAALAEQYKYTATTYSLAPSFFAQNKKCDLVLFALPHSQKEDWQRINELGLVEHAGGPHLIALTEPDDTEAVALAIQAGAWDVVSLHDLPHLQQTIDRCLYHRTATAMEHPTGPIRREGIIGTSSRLERCLRHMHVAARFGANILLLGETGTGKELFAHAAHQNSPRANRPFVVVDCTNLPSTLVASILFGYERGAYTGATESRDGLFKQVDGGTIFLDEIGDLDQDTQKSLLRVLQERKFRPVGAKKEIACNFGIIAATHTNLEDMVHQGSFRQDLYHRIKGRSIVLPSLRDRKEDIPALAEYYVSNFCKNQDCPVKQIGWDTMEILQRYLWPGNVRELINAMHNAVLNSHAESRIYPQHLPRDVRLFFAQHSGKRLERKKTRPSPPDTQALTQAEAEHIEQPTLVAEAKASPQVDIPQPSSVNTGTKFSGFVNIPPPSLLLEGIPLSLSTLPNLPPLRHIRESLITELERMYLLDLKNRCGGDFAQAQRIAGISRTRLYELLSKHTISI